MLVPQSDLISMTHTRLPKISHEQTMRNTQNRTMTAETLNHAIYLMSFDNRAKWCHNRNTIHFHPAQKFSRRFEIITQLNKQNIPVGPKHV